MADPRDKPVRQAVERAFSRSSEDLRVQREQLDRARQEVMEQQRLAERQLATREQQLQSASSVRNLDRLTRDAQLKDVSSIRSQISSQVQDRLKDIQQGERNIEKFSKEIDVAKAQALRKAFEQREESSASVARRAIGEIEQKTSQSLPLDIRREIIRSAVDEPNKPIIIDQPSTQGSIKIPDSKSKAVATLPSQGEFIRGSIRQKTGISVPSFQQSFNVLFRDEEPGSRPPSRITPIDVVTEPFIGTFKGIGDIAGGATEFSARKLGLGEVSVTVPSKVIPQRVTSGGEFILPETRMVVVSPRGLGTTARVGTQIGLIAGSGSLGALALGVEGTRESTRRDATISQRALGGAQAIAGFGFFGRSALKGLTKERLVSAGPIPKTSIEDIQIVRPVIIGEKIIEPGRVAVVAKTPERVGQVQTLFGRVTRKKPKEIIISPAQTRFGIADVVTSEGNILKGQLATRRRGATLTQFFKLEGGQRPFSIQDINSLTAAERKALISGVGSKTLGAFPTEGVEFFAGGISTKKLLRLSGKPSQTVEFRILEDGSRQLDILEPTISRTTPKVGTRTQRFSTASAVREFPLINSESRAFQTVSGIGETTFTGIPRNIQRAEGISIIAPTKSSSDIVKISKPGSPKTIQANKQVLDDLTLKNVAQATVKVIEKQSRPPLSKIPKSLRPISEEVALPRIVGGTGATSSFAGTGRFERTQETLSPISVAVIGTGNKQDSIPIGLSTNVQVSVQRSGAKQESRSISNVLESTRSLQIEVPLLSSKSKTSQAISSSQVQDRLNRQQQSQVQRQRVNQANRNLLRRERTPTRSPRLRISGPSQVSGATPIPKPVKVKKEAFDVQIRKGRKFVTIKEDLPKGKALKLGAEKVSDTIAASFRLVPSGTTTAEDITFDIPSTVFRRPKAGSQIKDPRGLTFVQKKGKRLSRRPEVREIQYFKRSKSGGRILGI